MNDLTLLGGNFSLLIMQKLLFGSSSSLSANKSVDSASSSNDSNNPSASTKNKAKVAFMITLAQRARLQQELNYNVQQIRKLTPLIMSTQSQST